MDFSALPDKRSLVVPLATARGESTNERARKPASTGREYLHRYLFALQFCDAKSVLDVACVDGYGSALLSSVAGHVTVLSAAKQADFLARAAQACGPTGAFDVVVSFETPPSIAESDAFFCEVKRVLRPGGILIFSASKGTWDSSNYHPGRIANIVSKLFADAAFLNQGGAETRPGGAAAVPASPDGPANAHGIWVASDSPLPKMRAGSLDDQDFDPSGELERLSVEAVRRESEIESLRRENGIARMQEARRELDLTRQREETVRREAENRVLRKENSAARARDLQREVDFMRRGEELLRREGELEALRQAREASHSRERAYEAELLQTQGERQFLAARAEDLEKQLRTLRQNEIRFRAQRDRRQNELSRFRSRDAESDAELQRLRDERAQIETASASLAAGLNRSSQRAALRKEELDDIKKSWSWKLSKPIRWLGMPVVMLQAGLQRLLFRTPMYRHTGKPFAKLASRITLPGAGWVLPRNPLFDADFYTREYPDAARSSKNLWAHYLGYGSDESRNPHPMFETSYYKEQHKDVAESGVNPLLHFFADGARRHHNPSPHFDTQYYLKNYPDVANNGINPLLHFALYGEAEGRRTIPLPEVSGLPNTSKQASDAQSSGSDRLISILTPTFNTPAKYLRQTIESVRRQSFQEWELCIYDDASTLAETREVLSEYQKSDPRIRIEFGAINRGIAAATNQALALARGQYIAMLDHDDEIAPDALSEVVAVLKYDPTLDVVYTDESYIAADGGSPEPLLKPDWSPEFFRGVMFVGHLLTVRRRLAIELGGFDSRFDRIQDFEFMLRVSEKTSRIHHLAKILYFWRRIPGSVAFEGGEKGAIEPLQAAAVNAHLKRLGIPALGEPNPNFAHRLVLRPLPRTDDPAVLVVIRERAARASASICFNSISQRSTYGNFKIIGIDELEKAAVANERTNGSGTSLDFGSAEYVIWIDSDLEVLTADWIEQLLLSCEQPQIACAAPVIIAPDGTIWNAGLVLGMGGSIGCSMQGMPSWTDGYAGSLSCSREVSCVSAECLMIATDHLKAIGGLVDYYKDPLYQGADFSLRAHRLGLRNIVTPRVVLRKSDTAQVEEKALDEALFADRWNWLVKHGDPFYNPNFGADAPGYDLEKLAAAAAS